VAPKKARRLEGSLTFFFSIEKGELKNKTRLSEEKGKVKGPGLEEKRMLSGVREGRTTYLVLRVLAKKKNKMFTSSPKEPSPPGRVSSLLARRKKKVAVRAQREKEKKDSSEAYPGKGNERDFQGPAKGARSRRRKATIVP